MKLLKFALLLIFLCTIQTQAALKCSGNGTSILFINGAFTSYDEQSDSVDILKGNLRNNSSHSFGTAGEVAWGGAGAVEWGRKC